MSTDDGGVPQYDANAADDEEYGKAVRRLSSTSRRSRLRAMSGLAARGMVGSGSQARSEEVASRDLMQSARDVASDIGLARQKFNEDADILRKEQEQEAAMQERKYGWEHAMQGETIGSTERMQEKDLAQKKWELQKELDDAVANRDWKTQERVGRELHGVEMQERSQGWQTGERLGEQQWTTGERLGTQAWTGEQNYQDQMFRLQQSREQLDLDYAGLDNDLQIAREKGDTALYSQLLGQMNDLNLQRNQIEGDQAILSQTQAGTGQEALLGYEHDVGMWGLENQGSIYGQLIDAQMTGNLAGYNALWNMQAQDASNRWGYLGQVLSNQGRLDLASFNATVDRSMANIDYDYTKRLLRYMKDHGMMGEGGGGFDWGSLLSTGAEIVSVGASLL